MKSSEEDGQGYFEVIQGRKVLYFRRTKVLELRSSYMKRFIVASLGFTGSSFM